MLITRRMFVNSISVLFFISLQSLLVSTRQVADSNPILPNTSTCGHYVPSDKTLTEEKIAAIDDFPWIARIEYQLPKRRQFSCIGSLINDRYILTGAHCVKDLPTHMEVVSVRLGEYNTSTEPDCTGKDTDKICAPPVQDIKVEEIIAHDGFSTKSKSFVHDIALLRLAHSVTFSDFIKPICIPQTQLEERHVGERMYITGWDLSQRQDTLSNVKLKYDIPVISNDNCSEIYQKTTTLHPTQLCAGGEEGRDACNGDGGGPLMSLDKMGDNKYNWFVRGIVSFGPRHCGRKGWPSVYTRVNDYVEWISSHVRA